MGHYIRGCLPNCARHALDAAIIHCATSLFPERSLSVALSFSM